MSNAMAYFFYCIQKRTITFEVENKMIFNKLAELVFRFGASKRNPSLFSIYHELKESESYDLKKLKAIQLKKLKRLIEFSEKNSPFYNKLFENSGFVSNDILSLNDLKKIPIVEKSELLRNIDGITSRYRFNKVYEAETSGTTGDALKFGRNEEWDSTNRAALMRSYDWYGVKPWNYNGYLWGFNISGIDQLKVKLLDFLQNRIRLFSYDKDEIESFVRRLESASYLSGYSSMNYEVAKAINRMGVKSRFKRMKLVKATSETILDIYKNEVKKAFGLNLTSEYGAAEAGLIAFECPEGNMHINMENVILETNDNNEAIVTNLVSYSFPIIRYNLGDVVELEDSEFKCSCGLNHSIIKKLTGRKGSSVIGKKSKYPALTFYYVFKNLALKNSIFLNYRAYQDKPGIVDLLIEQEVSEKFSALLNIELKKYFGDDLDVRVSWSEDLNSNKTKKAQYFSTTIG